MAHRSVRQARRGLGGRGGASRARKYTRKVFWKNLRHSKAYENDSVWESFNNFAITISRVYLIPLFVHRSSWYENKHFRGSYSFRSIESADLNVWAKDLAEPIKDSSDKPVRIFDSFKSPEMVYLITYLLYRCVAFFLSGRTLRRRSYP